MKIIDLLNKIANSEEIPKKIKYDGIYYLIGENEYYNENDLETPLFLNVIEKGINYLNDEVEIIEDTPITKQDCEGCYEYRKLKDNWNKLEEWLKESLNNGSYSSHYEDGMQEVLNKMQEIKGSDESEYKYIWQ